MGMQVNGINQATGENQKKMLREGKIKTEDYVNFLFGENISDVAKQKLNAVANMDGDSTTVNRFEQTMMSLFKEEILNNDLSAKEFLAGLSDPYFSAPGKQLGKMNTEM